MSTVTRDEFETVKELLASAARYAESANRGLDRLESSQETLNQQMERLIESQRRTESQLEQLAAALTRTDAQLIQFATTQQRSEERLESFMFESQRILTSQAERISRLEGISERLEAILAYLVRGEGPGE